MTPDKPESEMTGTDDVRRVREAIARQHNGNLAEHIAETNRIVEELRAQGKVRLGPIVQPPPRPAKFAENE